MQFKIIFCMTMECFIFLFENNIAAASEQKFNSEAYTSASLRGKYQMCDTYVLKKCGYVSGEVKLVLHLT